MKKLVKFKSLNKRFVTLIEVLISFAIITMCILPLLYPHVFILKQQNEFTHKIELDHQVNLLYGEILSRLYTNEISWTDLLDSREVEINEELITQAGITGVVIYEGKYQFQVERKKNSEDLSKTALLLNLNFHFFPKYDQTTNKTLNYKYQIFAYRDITEEVQENESREAVESIPEEGA